jgi:hypothetical protein
MRLRSLTLFCCLACAGFAADPSSVGIRGKLIRPEGQPPALETADHRMIALDGDKATEAVLHDERLAGFDLEAKGHFTAPNRFLVDPMHTRAMLVHKDGQVKVITYWCDTCSIRTHTPGPCWCCQRETTLDLRDPADDQ